MTTDEIRALVAQKIAGQGSAVDVGGGLPTILNAICDALDTIPAPYTLPAATYTKLGGIKIGKFDNPGTSSLAPFGIDMSVDGTDVNRVALPAIHLKAAHGASLSFENLTKEQAEAAIGDGNVDFIDDLVSGRYAGIYVNNYYINLTYVFYANNSGQVLFGGTDVSRNFGISYQIIKEPSGLYNASLFEI